MTFLTALEVFNYCLVLIFGLLLSAFIAGGWNNQGRKWLIFLMCPALLAIQGICCLLWGIETTRQIYPLIVHLPLMLILIFALKKSVGVALVSVCTAYLCCQIPRWMELAMAAATGSMLLGKLLYIPAIAVVFFLLCRYFVRPAHSAMTYSSRSLLLFGSLPVAYYLFDYATAVYSDALYVGIRALNEFLPTALIIFYVIFLSAYHTQSLRRMEAELQQAMLESELRQTSAQIERLRDSGTQAAIYQHDMRHHLTAIEGFLSAGKFQQAEEYIKKVQADVDEITPKRFCENELVNLLCSSFSGKAERVGIQLTVEARLPKIHSISDTELCSVLSNGLENALCAVSPLEQELKWVDLYCEVRLNKLLIEIKNPYAGEIAMRDGLPISNQEGHGYGCRSIRAIAEQYRGLCTFEPADGVFTLRVVLPVYEEAGQTEP